MRQERIKTVRQAAEKWMRELGQFITDEVIDLVPHDGPRRDFEDGVAAGFYDPKQRDEILAELRANEAKKRNRRV